MAVKSRRYKAPLKPGVKKETARSKRVKVTDSPAKARRRKEVAGLEKRATSLATFGEEMQRKTGGPIKAAAKPKAIRKPTLIKPKKKKKRGVRSLLKRRSKALKEI